MRFLHTADWHIGKKLNGYELLTDQRAVIEQLITMVEEQQLDALVIAGDVYDRSVPSVEAVALLNDVLETVNLVKNIPIFAVSGNHDSAVRLHTGAPWFKQTTFHLVTDLAEALKPISFKGTQCYLLPYFEPIAARLYFQDDTIQTIAQAVERVVAEMKTTFDPTQKHLLISHFFVAGSLRSESETPIEVGGLASVPRELFADFDYTALGHLHSPQALKTGTVRYSGAPLCYSLSEAEEVKGAWLVDTETGEQTFLEVTPLRPVRIKKAAFTELIDPAVYQTLPRDAFWHFELTDRAVIPNMMNQLRQIYPHLLSVERLTGQVVKPLQRKRVTKQLAPETLIADFFHEQTGGKLTASQKEWLDKGLSYALDTEKRDNYATEKAND